VKGGGLEGKKIQLLKKRVAEKGGSLLDSLLSLETLGVGSFLKKQKNRKLFEPFCPSKKKKKSPKPHSNEEKVKQLV